VKKSADFDMEPLTALTTNGSGDFLQLASIGCRERERALPDAHGGGAGKLARGGVRGIVEFRRFDRHEVKKCQADYP
jgi:hypothetical protein